LWFGVFSNEKSNKKKKTSCNNAGYFKQPQIYNPLCEVLKFQNESFTSPLANTHPHPHPHPDLSGSSS
jgi:hypothetical protein